MSRGPSIDGLKQTVWDAFRLYLMLETGRAGWRVVGSASSGLSAVAADAAYVGMNKGGGHAMRHLIEGGIIANQGSLASRVAKFRELTRPILRKPCKTFKWKIGDTEAIGYAGKVGGKDVVLFVAQAGKYAGKVIGSVIPDAAQMAQWGLK